MRLLKAKTKEAYTIKTLAELVQNSLHSACLETDKDGIIMKGMDSDKNILLYMELKRENFVIFKCTKPIQIGINLFHFYKMLKSIKKKDCITLFIDNKNPMDLGICVKQSEESNKTTTFIKCTRIQPIDVPLPTGYGDPIICSSKEFQKMSKNLAAVGKVIRVESRNYWIKFSADGGELYKREVIFGEEEEDDDDEADPNTDTKETRESEPYIQNFLTEQITQHCKVAGLSANLQMYPTPGLPLKIKLSVGSLGFLSIYIKSQEQIKEEKQAPTAESDDEGESGNESDQLDIDAE